MLPASKPSKRAPGASQFDFYGSINTGRFRLSTESILKIAAYGAWNGGRVVDNTAFENCGMVFKNNIPCHQPDHRGENRRSDPRRCPGKCPYRPHRLSGSPGPLRAGPLADQAAHRRHQRGGRQNRCRPPDPLSAGLSRRRRARAHRPGPLRRLPGFQRGGGGGVHALAGRHPGTGGHFRRRRRGEHPTAPKPSGPGDTASIIFGDDSLATALETVGSGRHGRPPHCRRGPFGSSSTATVSSTAWPPPSTTSPGGNGSTV